MLDGILLYVRYYIILYYVMMSECILVLSRLRYHQRNDQKSGSKIGNHTKEESRQDSNDCLQKWKRLNGYLCTTYIKKRKLLLFDGFLTLLYSFLIAYLQYRREILQTCFHGIKMMCGHVVDTWINIYLVERYLASELLLVLSFGQHNSWRRQTILLFHSWKHGLALKNLFIHSS